MNYIISEILKLYPANMVGDVMFFKGAPVTTDMLGRIKNPKIVLVVGSRGVGKSVYARAMSKYQKNTLYFELQNVNLLTLNILMKVVSIIEIHELGEI